MFEERIISGSSRPQPAARVAVGDVRVVQTSQDGRTLVLPATTEGGRVYVLRDGRALTTLVRLVMPWGLLGNLRLGEIVLHGQALGSSHPKVIAKKPRAVLFDENEDDMRNLRYPCSRLGRSVQGSPGLR